MQCVCAILSFVAHLVLFYFSTLSHKGMIFGKTLLRVKRVFCFSLELLSEVVLILRIIKRVTIINAHRS